MHKPVKKTAREQTQAGRAAKAKNDNARWTETVDLIAQGKSDREIAQILNRQLRKGEKKITPNAIKKRRHRINQQLFGTNTSNLGGHYKTKIF